MQLEAFFGLDRQSTVHCFQQQRYRISLMTDENAQWHGSVQRQEALTMVKRHAQHHDVVQRVAAASSAMRAPGIAWNFACATAPERKR